MHQTVILTSHEISPDTLKKLFMILQGRSPEEGWHGTAFKLADTVEVQNTVSQPEIESLYGRIAP